MSEVEHHLPADDSYMHLLAEARRQELLHDKKLTTVLSDAELLTLLEQARRTVDALELPLDAKEITAPYTDLEKGPVTGLLPRKVVLILAELYHLVRELVAERFKADYNEPGADLFHVAELPGCREVQLIMPDHVTSESSQRVQEYVRVALDLDRDAVLDDIANSNAPIPELVQGSLYIDTPALNAPESIIVGVKKRLSRTFNTPPVHIVRSMKEWRNWKHLIQSAQEEDVPDIHALYQSVLMPRERLLKLDPRYASKTEFRSVADDVRNQGAMFKALRTNGNDDEVREGLQHGRIAIIRDERQEDTPDVPGELIGFYNVVSRGEVVRSHMKSELHFSNNRSYDSVDELPHFSRFEEPTGEMKTISYSDEEGALRVFKAAANDTLGWSVDHAVRMNGPQKLQRYAMAGTALKLDEYEYMRKVESKNIVLMKIATVIGVDSSGAANELGVQAVEMQEWLEDGQCSWNVDQSKMVVLPRAIVNVGSTMLNGRLGAHEVFTVTEEFCRDGIRVRILWRYLAQHLPADIPV